MSVRYIFVVASSKPSSPASTAITTLSPSGSLPWAIADSTAISGCRRTSADRPA